MKKIETIKEKKSFDDIIHNGYYKKNKFYVIYIKKANAVLNNYQIGIAISKSYGNAVSRNKIKRQTRNIIDNNKKLFNKNNFYIIMIRKELNSADFLDMNKKFKELMEEINEKF